MGKQCAGIVDKAKNTAIKGAVATIIAGFLVIFQGCAEDRDKSRLKSFLLQEQKIGTVVKLSSIYDKEMDWVCVVRPYHDQIYDENPQNLAINEFLQEIKYREREHLWSLVMSKNDSFDIITFRRSKMGIAFGNESWIHLPENFEAVECTDFEQSAIFKISLEGRVYFVFGRIK